MTASGRAAIIAAMYRPRLEIAGGSYHVGTRGNNTGGIYGSTSVSGELEVYGLKPN